MRSVLLACLLLGACTGWNPNLPPKELACFEAGGGDECLALNPNYKPPPDMEPMPDMTQPPGAVGAACKADDDCDPIERRVVRCVAAGKPDGMGGLTSICCWQWAPYSPNAGWTCDPNWH